MQNIFSHSMQVGFIIISFLFLNKPIFSQQVQQPAYPRMMGYVSFVHPIASFDKNGSHFNFSNSYTIGFPFGLNLLKSDKMGFSFEITPFIRSEKGISKVNNVLFHPGAMFRFKHNFVIISRMAFETAGRYGVTAVFNKTFIKKKNMGYFAAIPVPFRFGNNQPASVGFSLQLGINF